MCLEDGHKKRWKRVMLKDRMLRGQNYASLDSSFHQVRHPLSTNMLTIVVVVVVVGQIDIIP